MKILINFLGIVIYFLARYNNKTNQNAEFSVRYWIKDNWQESLTVILFDVVLMLLLMAGGVTIDLTKLIPSLPVGIAFVGDLAICFFIGLLLASGAYELYKSKNK